MSPATVRHSVRHAAGGTWGHLGHAFGLFGTRCASLSRFCWRIFRSALRLQPLGVKYAIASETAVGQGLGVVLKGIGWSFRPAVHNWKNLVLLDENEFDLRSGAPDGSGLNIAGNAQPLAINVVPFHAAELFNGDVIALALLHARVGEVRQRYQDQYGRAAKFEVFAGFARHEPSPIKLTLTCRCPWVKAFAGSQFEPRAKQIALNCSISGLA